MKHLLISLIAATAISAEAARATSLPILSPDKLESTLVTCIELGFIEGCWRKNLEGNFDNKQPDAQMAITLSEKNYIGWLGGKRVFKVHHGPVEKAAGIFESRAYIIERDDGELAGLVIGFRKTLGKWFLYELNGSPSEEYIRSILNMRSKSTKKTEE
ncbi:hypothetical protein IFU04_22335 [Pseudomonas syringae]|nr:hypothetical protein [Pseudomonas syringae]